MARKGLEIDGRHCDEYIRDYNSPKCLRWFLFINRLPAVDKMLASERGVNPTLFAHYKRKRVRVVMASRLGDVGITEDLGAERGYSKRVAVAELSRFSVHSIPGSEKYEE